MRQQRLSRRTFVKGTAVAAAATAPALSATAAPRPARRRRQEGETVTFWMFGGTPGNIEYYTNELIPMCEEQLGITVDLQERDWARQREDILAAITAGDVPDVMRVHNKYVAEFGESGILKQLEDYDDFDEVAATFVPSYLATVSHDANHYGLPEGVLPFVLAVNQELLDAAGVDVPTTWEEFVAAAKALSNPDEGTYGYTFPGGVNLDTAYRFAPWLYKAGGRVLNDDWTAAVFNEEPGVAALEMLLELQSAGALPEGNAAYAFAENADLWGAQKAAMSTEGPWWQNVMRDQYNLETDKLTIAPVPAPAQPIGEHPPATLLDVTMLTIMADGPNPDAAWELLKCMRAPENDLAFTDPNQGGVLPATQAAYEEGVDWGFIGKDTYIEQAGAVEIWPNHPQITEIQMALAAGLNAAFAGTASAQEALDDAADEVQEILDD